MTTLSNSDKLVIVEQKIKNIEYQKYGVELELLMENALTSPDSQTVTAHNSAIAGFNAKLSVLETEKASLEE